MRFMPSDLVKFTFGLTWEDMYRLTDNQANSWWRIATVEAREAGFVRWDSDRKKWFLTEKGEKFVNENLRSPI